jgi:Ca2+-transporting ATPase
LTTAPPVAGNSGRIPSLTRYAWLSVLAALITIALKTQAYLATGSVGLLSDAVESLVNLAAAVVTLTMLAFAARPADEGHPFGHGKAEYFASGFEGVLILVAAAGIAWAAWARLQHPQPLAEVDVGMGLSAGAAAINLTVAVILLRAGRKHGSIALEADGRHLLSDVWTTGAILLALGGILMTGWLLLDPVVAFLAAAQIAWSGLGLIRRSVSGLLDAAMPPEEKAAIEHVFDRYRTEVVGFHDLRTRVAGTQRLMTVHVLVPGDRTVQQGHDLVERIEADIRSAVRNITIVTHLEPVEDEASFAHERLDRPRPVAGGKPHHEESNTIRKRKTRFGEDQPERGRPVWTLGVVLLVLGGVASMLFEGFRADAALGLSLLGLVMVLARLRGRV